MSRIENYYAEDAQDAWGIRMERRLMLPTLASSNTAGPEIYSEWIWIGSFDHGIYSGIA